MFFDERVKDIYREAKRYAAKRGAKAVKSVHLLMGFLVHGEVTKDILAKYGLTVDALENVVDILDPLPLHPPGPQDPLPMYSRRMLDIRHEAFMIADGSTDQFVNEKHLLLGLLSTPEALAINIIDAYVPVNVLKDEIKELISTKTINQVIIEEGQNED